MKTYGEEMRYYIFKKIYNILKMNCYICGCVLNCEKYLINVFKNIEKIGNIFDNYKIIIAYDISIDNSLKLLFDIKDKFKNICDIEIIVNKNPLSNYKTENIANARNSILNYIKNDKDNINYEYFIMMDVDDVSDKKINIDILYKYLIRDDWDSLSFNREDYYDIWALSIKPYVVSCWHWADKQINSLFVVDMMKDYISKKLKELNSEDLLECYSAFNGFAIYRKDKFINSYYSNNIFKSLYLIDNDLIKENIKIINQTIKINLLEDCEHRFFHLNAIKKYGAKIKISPHILFINDQENNCKYVSSRGILKSCDVKSLNPISSINNLYNYNFSKLYDGCTLYVCNFAIKIFINYVKYINVKFILVSGDSDCTVPNEIFSSNEDFISFIENNNIIHWYSQNCILSDHPKLSKIPIGLDYHTMNEKDSDWGNRLSPNEQEDILENIKNSSKPFWEREIKCYSNFHFFIETKYGYDRKEAIDEIDKELILYENNKINRKETWLNQSKYAFVISPHGNGLDCHRTWEALCLGSIPIIKKSNITNLFDELPVLIVDNWSDINKDLLNKTIYDFKNKKFNYDKLLLKYWIDKITDMRKNIINDNYKFFHGVDHNGDDIELKHIFTIDELKKYCDSNEKIVAFNTLGFIKINVNIENLIENNYINKNTLHGIFIKKKYLSS